MEQVARILTLICVLALGGCASLMKSEAPPPPWEETHIMQNEVVPLDVLPTEDLYRVKWPAAGLATVGNERMATFDRTAFESLQRARIMCEANYEIGGAYQQAAEMLVTDRNKMQELAIFFEDKANITGKMVEEEQIQRQHETRKLKITLWRDRLLLGGAIVLLLLP